MDIDIVLNDIDDLVSGVLNIAQPRRELGNKTFSPSLINIRVNMTATPLDESLSSDTGTKLYPRRERNDPLIDVIETGDQIRVIAILPGIRTEDAWFDVKNGILTIEISKYGQVLRKDIKCNMLSDQISIKSATVKNSVLEVVFDKV